MSKNLLSQVQIAHDARRILKGDRRASFTRQLDDLKFVRHRADLLRPGAFLEADEANSRAPRGTAAISHTIANLKNCIHRKTLPDSRAP